MSPLPILIQIPHKVTPQSIHHKLFLFMEANPKRPSVMSPLPILIQIPHKVAPQSIHHKLLLSMEANPKK